VLDGSPSHVQGVLDPSLPSCFSRLQTHL